MTSEVQDKLNTVKLIMHDNIETALQNCTKLENIELKSEDLQQQAMIFKKSASDLKHKMWWKNMKAKLIVATIIILVLGIITGIIVAYTKTNN